MTARCRWQQVAEIYDRQSAEYDRWFADNSVFEAEVAALKQLSTPKPGPTVEIGLGPGHFAQALDIDYGIDPAFSPLLLARERNISAIQAIGENLPFRSYSIGSVFLLFTLCFSAEPQTILNEVHTILKKQGVIILGEIPKEGFWGRKIIQKQKAGNSFYHFASLFDPDELATLLTACNFKLIEARSALLANATLDGASSRSCVELKKDAGFVIMVAQKN